MTVQFNKDVDQIKDAAGRPYPDCLIIDRPDLKSRPLIMGERIITVLFWGFWFYLWLPLISLLAWMAGFKFLYRHMVELGGFSGFLEQLHIFISGVVLVTGAIALWGLYNFKRYASYTRRNRVLETNPAQLAVALNVSENKLLKIQQTKRIVFFFAEDDSIKEVALSCDCLRDTTNNLPGIPAPSSTIIKPERIQASSPKCRKPMTN